MGLMMNYIRFRSFFMVLNYQMSWCLLTNTILIFLVYVMYKIVHNRKLIEKTINWILHMIFCKSTVTVKMCISKYWCGIVYTGNKCLWYHIQHSLNLSKVVLFQSLDFLYLTDFLLKELVWKYNILLIMNSCQSFLLARLLTQPWLIYWWCPSIRLSVNIYINFKKMFYTCTPEKEAHIR